MNLLKKQEGIEIHFYDEDNLKDSTSLKNSFLEFLDYFQNQTVSIKFVDLNSIRLEALSIVLSFTKELGQKGNSCIWVCSESLRKQLTQLGVHNLIKIK